MLYNNDIIIVITTNRSYLDDGRHEVSQIISKVSYWLSVLNKKKNNIIYNTVVEKRPWIIIANTFLAELVVVIVGVDRYKLQNLSQPVMPAALSRYLHSRICFTFHGYCSLLRSQCDSNSILARYYNKFVYSL